LDSYFESFLPTCPFSFVQTQQMETNIYSSDSSCHFLQSMHEYENLQQLMLRTLAEGTNY
jgi:hypothetical protein